MFRETCEQAIHLRFDLHNALVPLGEVGRLFDALHEAEPLAEALEDRRRLGRVSTLESAEAVYQHALALAEELGMQLLLAHAHLGLGSLYFTIGRLTQARTGLAAAVEDYRALEMTYWLPQAEAVLAWVIGAGAM